MKYKISILILGLASGVANAQTCKYVDDIGRVTYSNIAVKGATKVMCFDAVPGPRRSTSPSSASTPSPENFPKVDSQTQRKRDDARRKILENELVEEQKALDEAKQALSEGEATRLGGEKNYQKYLDRVQKLKDTVVLHEKNVAALKQEISNLK